MGYQTCFVFKVKGLQAQAPVGDMTGRRPPTHEDLAQNLEMMTNYSFYVMEPAKDPEWGSRPSWWTKAHPEGEKLIYVSDVKWYPADREPVLDQLSALYPDLEFWILGVGEDAEVGDIWCQVYKNGRHTERENRYALLWGVDQDQVRRLKEGT